MTTRPPRNPAQRTLHELLAAERDVPRLAEPRRRALVADIHAAAAALPRDLAPAPSRRAHFLLRPAFAALLLVALVSTAAAVIVVRQRPSEAPRSSATIVAPHPAPPPTPATVDEGPASPPRAAPDRLEAELRSLEAARRALREHRTRDARTALAEHANRFPNGVLAEEHAGLEVALLVAEGRHDEARRALASLRATHPRSPLLPRLEALIPPRR